MPLLIAAWRYDIVYDDGDFEAMVPEFFVREQGERSPQIPAKAVATKASAVAHASEFVWSTSRRAAKLPAAEPPFP